MAGVLQSLGIAQDVVDAISIICCFNGALPQGSPSSPIISNMICFRLDKELLIFAKQNRCIYTRYADDLSFSSFQPLNGLFKALPPSQGHFSPDLLNEKLQQIFIENGFLLNPDKAIYADRYSRRTVTGIWINEALNVDRRFVRNLRAALYSVETLGIAAAQEKLTSTYKIEANIGNHLQGKISWLKYIKGSSDPVFRKLALRFNNSFAQLNIKIDPSLEEIQERPVWIIEKGTSQGTAFFLEGIGLVTAAHCIFEKEDGKLELYHPSKASNKFDITVRDMCKHQDVALLNHSIPNNEFYELKASTKTVEVGGGTQAFGYPDFGPGDKLNIRTGNVTSLPIKSAVRMIEVEQRLSQGMSGGPLLDINNEVIGIIHKGGSGHERQLSIDIRFLLDWLKKAKK